MNKLSSPVSLIKESFEIFFARENFVKFIKIYAWLLPFQAFFLYQNYYVSMQSQVLNETNTTAILSKNPSLFTLVVVANVLFFLVSFMVELSAITSLNRLSEGGNLNLKEVFSSAKSKVLRFFLLSLLLGLVVTLGIVFLIIPGLIFAVWYSFSKYVFVDKEVGILDSLKESRKLVKGRFWGVAGRLLIFVFFGALVQLVFAVVPYGIGSVASSLFGALLILPSFLLYKELSS